MSKKVLIIITTAFVPYGGLTTVMMNYYRAMDKTDLQIDFASTNEPPEELAEELRRNGSAYFNLESRKRSLVRYIRNLCKVLKQGNYDVIHVNGNSATMAVELMAAKAMKVKTRIAHAHNTVCNHRILHSILKPIFERRYTDAIACSNAAGNWIYPKGGFEVLNNAIDLKRYHFDENNRQKIRTRYNIPDTDKVIGHVGKMSRQKNHVFLLNIFAEIMQRDTHWRLMLVGDGVLRRELEKKAKELGIGEKTIFCGMQNATESFYSAFDFFVFPSLWEGLPLSLLEAQANGLGGVVSDLITPEACIAGGVYCKPLSEGAAAWADLVSDIHNQDREARSEQNCRLLQEMGFDISKNAQTLRIIYMR